MNDYLELLLGVFLAFIGGELFVKGTVGLAHWVRISPGVIGVTVAAFATSSPELSVSITSAMAGTPQIALGDALGSNVVNVALILGLALTISGIQSSRDSIKRDFPIALVVPALTGGLFLDGKLSSLEGGLMLVAFMAWIVIAIIDARKQRNLLEKILEGAIPIDGKQKWMVVLSCLFGLIFLVGAGNFIVTGARGIALSFGMEEFIIGATVVAIGTSVPELASTVIAKLRGHDDVGLGIILGSNIFNGLFIVPITAIIHPITMAWHSVAFTLLLGLAAVLLTFPTGSGYVNRGRGIALLSLYMLYSGIIIQFGMS